MVICNAVANEVQIDLSALQQGAYVLQLEAEGAAASVEILKL